MATIGYARVSTDDQNLALQFDALKGVGCDHIFEDTASGALTNRPGLAQALTAVQEGDTLVVWRIDRLGRSVKNLVDLTVGLQECGVEFKSIKDGIDTTTIQGRFFFHVMAAFAEMEREIMRERTRAGLTAARARGRTGGRPRAMTDEKVALARELLLRGTSPREVSVLLGTSVPSLYRLIPASSLERTDAERSALTKRPRRRLRSDDDRPSGSAMPQAPGDVSKPAGRQRRDLMVEDVSSAKRPRRKIEV